MFELFFKYSRDTFERGELLFASEWPLWLLAVLVVAGALAFAVSLYRYRQDLSLAKSVAIGALQTLMWGCLLLMLWRPALLTQTLRAQENSVALLVDASASMNYGEGEASRLEEAVGTLQDDLLPDLEESLEVDMFAFSDSASGISSLDGLSAVGATTRIGDGLLDILRNSNAGALAAVILVSDGVDNSTELDAARIADIASFGVPVHTVGVGREVIEEDLELEDVVIAAQGPAGSTVSAQVSIRHADNALAQVKIYDGDAILASEPVQLPNTAGVTTRWIDIDVGDAGVRDLRFTVDALPGERNLINNTQLRPMEVPEQRRSILYIEGEPRWEYKYVRRAIVDEDVPIRFVTLLRTTPNKFYRQGVSSGDELADGFPADESELFSYDALIIGSLEAAALSEEQRQMIYDFVSRRGGTLLMLGARRGLADGGWGATVVNDVLPVDLPADVGEPSFIRLPARAMLPDGEQSLITRFDADDAANRVIWDELPLLKDLQLIERGRPQARCRGAAQGQPRRRGAAAARATPLRSGVGLCSGRQHLGLANEPAARGYEARDLLAPVVAGADDVAARARDADDGARLLRRSGRGHAACRRPRQRIPAGDHGDG